MLRKYVGKVEIDNTVVMQKSTKTKKRATIPVYFWIKFTYRANVYLNEHLLSFTWSTEHTH